MIEKNDKCANCPLAEILQLTISLNKRMANQRFKEYKPIKDYKCLLDIQLQLN